MKIAFRLDATFSEEESRFDLSLYKQELPPLN